MLGLTPLEERCVAAFKQRVTSAVGPTATTFRLFGSRARGESHEESDVDVLVLLTKSNRATKEMIWDIANDLLLEEWVHIAPLVMSVEEFQTLLDRERRIALDIQAEGIPL
ncbi:MAG: nucleotidyltransferase domain-containing protein [Deltaproteobacteria bacterium]|nr:nucleotidyltransferase domain-containing protein [Deltaproteobacteria bacterium]